MPTEMTLARSPAAAAPVMRLTKRQKAAIVVRLLRSEGIDLSLAGLPETLQIRLTQDMGGLRVIDRDTLRAVVSEFVSELDTIGLSFPSGLRGALKLLEGTISSDTAERLRSEAGIDLVTDPWDRLGRIDAERLRPLIEEESTEIGAVALSRLNVAKAAQILGLLPGAAARRLAYAMGQTGAVRPEVVARIGEALIARIDSEAPRAFAGAPVERVGAVLNSSGSAIRDEVLEGLDAEDRAFAAEVRKTIFTFANIPQRIDARDVPKIARAMDAAVLTRALAAAAPAPKTAPAAEFILSNMSQRLAQQFRDEMETLGQIRDSDGEEAMSAVIGTIRNMEAEGELALLVEEA